ncbi:hypothetical protein COV58_03695 [Candidatus Roizmanbacteria bacterium CG11_big_fil_rev_8_21_14_0_20_36_8]|uniref:Uncharacterized protein n=2 Tax=Candidatus Roizmaniibacteriota TaxID=1752723 RepID=A0A2M6ITM5_9BACT|nr:MAG: hypothetical protein COV58_03695 [Candidatus Roizmanbacteria bacterium CG11_big_fil_rev_8_21_14_0_20_36_8]
MKIVHQLIKITVNEFVRDNVAQMAAALSYYALFAIPSIFLISLQVLNIFLADEQSQYTLIAQISELTGGANLDIVLFIIAHLREYSLQGTLVQWVGVGALVISALGAFGHLQASLNTIFNIAPHPDRSIFVTFKKRVLSVTFVLLIALVILLSFVFRTIVHTFESVTINSIGITPFILQSIDLIGSFAGMVIFISLIFRFLPEGKVAWKDIFIGSIVTSCLLLLGKYLIGFLITFNTFSSIYGATGSLLIMLIWIYYLSIVLFLGAEFTQVYSHLHGKGVSHGDDTISTRS